MKKVCFLNSVFEILKIPSSDKKFEDFGFLFSNFILEKKFLFNTVDVIQTGKISDKNQADFFQFLTWKNQFFWTWRK